MKRASRRRLAKPTGATPVAAKPVTQDFFRTVELTPRFLACAESWFLTPEELARRVCEDFEINNPPGSPIIFIVDARREDS